MAFTLENNYLESNKIELLKSETNPYANGGYNAEKVRVGYICGDKLEIVASFVVTSATDVTATLGAPSDAYDHRYFKVVVSDQHGNSATNVGTGVVASVVVNTLTAGLNVNDEWTIEVFVAGNEDLLVNCDCQTELSFTVANPSSDPTIAINTETYNAQLLAITQSNLSTIVADGGSYDIGDFAAGGTTEAFTIGLKNNGQTALKITSATPAGDVLSITLGAYDKVIYPGQVIAISGTVDASGGVAAYSGTVTVVSDDPSNASYAITIAYDLV